MYKVPLNLPFLEAFHVTLMLVLHLFRLPKMAGSRDTLYIESIVKPAIISVQFNSDFNTSQARAQSMGHPQTSSQWVLASWILRTSLAQGNSKLSPFLTSDSERVCNFFSRLVTFTLYIYLSGLTYSQPGKSVEGSSSTAWDFLPCVRFLPCSVHQCPDPTSKLSAVM